MSAFMLCRSQCIINILGSSSMHGDEDGFSQNDTVLTIVDLARAERERRTGIQGPKLLESNFINNTSMIFALLEHQRIKKPFEKALPELLVDQVSKRLFGRQEADDFGFLRNWREVW